MTTGARVAAAVFAALVRIADPAVAQQNAVTAFVDVAVVPMDRERVLPHQTVLVQGERIIALGAARQVRVPDEAARIDGRGKFLIPGLADMHAHIGHSDLTADDGLVPEALFFFVAQGVTTVRDLASGPAHLLLKARVARGELLGPRIYTAWRPEECDEAMDVTTCISAAKQAGYDFLKMHRGGADLSWFDSVITAADQVGLRVVGHVPDKPENVGLERVLAARYASIEHLDGYFEYLTRSSGAPVGAGSSPEHGGGWSDTLAWAQPDFHWDAAKLHAIAVTTRRAGVWQTPTLRAGEVLITCSPDTGTGNTNPAGVAGTCRWHQLRRQILKALHDDGVGILTGTDAVPIRDDQLLEVFRIGRVTVHDELEALVAAGLTPYQALAAGTRNAAASLGTLQQTGTIAAGKVADLVLLEGNPLADIDQTARPAGVMVRGRWLPRAELDAGMAPLKKAAAP